MTPLEEEIRAEIRRDGSIGVDRFMAACLSHPEHGYYMTRDPFGVLGDFTTAPEISQVFGELIGIWAVAVWEQMGQPDKLRLVEFGPGRGTLMSDMLRAARVRPAFLEAVDVSLVETSPILRAAQARMLVNAPVPVRWCEIIEEVPKGPAIMVANEFFDALPIRQFEIRAGVWRERRVGIVGERLMFVLGEPTPAPLPTDAPEESVFEVNQAGLGQAWLMADRLAKEGGAALIIDYGHAQTAYGETLQAVGKHRFANVLAAPGTLDLTAHVDFGALAHMAGQAGATAHGPIRQNAFLSRLNMVGRLERLLENAPDERSAETMIAGCRRLLDDEPTGMGRLFKALALTHPALAPPPAFEHGDAGL